MNAKKACRANGDVGVAREISVNLEGEEHGAHHECGARVICVIGEDVVDVDSAGVGHHHFFEEPPQDQPQPADRSGVVKLASRGDLGQQGRGTFDGAGHELGEEADKRRKLNQIVCRLKSPTVNVNRVGEGLKGVEADAHGQDDFQAPGVHVNPDSRPRLNPVFNEKVGVFEIAEQP